MKEDNFIRHQDLLIRFRKTLHQHAELAGFEIRTHQLISEFLHEHAPDAIFLDVGKTGLAAIFEGDSSGPTIIFRADIDAVPIPEGLPIAHASLNESVSHKCGHDGHATILCGLACMLQEAPPPSGKVILLFQPAEETGKGAKEMLDDSLFEHESPDYIFALHNLPGVEKNCVVVRKEHFASASKGMIIKLEGKPAHAAYPEYGVSPALAMTEIIRELQALPDENDMFDDFVLTTIVYASLGNKAFGTAPGNAEIMLTLRSYDNKNMNRLVHEAMLLCNDIAEQHGLRISYAWTDEFSETYNHPKAVDIIEQAAKQNNLTISHMSIPFRWSEDFGQYTSHFKGAMFGLGIGKDHPALHTAAYDFPDDCIASGVNIMYNIYHSFYTK